MRTSCIIHILLLLTTSVNLAKAGNGVLSKIMADNTKPRNGIVGFSIEGISVNSKNGEIFVDSIPDAPHGEFGFSIGLDYWKKYVNHYDYHLGFEIKYNHYHFHKSFGAKLVEHDGYMHHLYLSIPFTFSYPLPQYPHIFILAGASINTLNLMPIKRGGINGYAYDTKITTNWPIYPSFHFGLNILEEKTRKAFYRLQVTYSVAPFKNLGYKANIYYPTYVENATGVVKTGRAELKFIYYPKWKKDIRNNTECK